MSQSPYSFKKGYKYGLTRHKPRIEYKPKPKPILSKRHGSLNARFVCITRLGCCVVLGKDARDRFLAEMILHYFQKLGVFEGVVGYVLVGSEDFGVEVGLDALDFTAHILFEQPFDVGWRQLAAEMPGTPVLRRLFLETLHQGRQQLGDKLIGALFQLGLHRRFEGGDFGP